MHLAASLAVVHRPRRLRCRPAPDAKVEEHPFVAATGILRWDGVPGEAVIRCDWAGGPPPAQSISVHVAGGSIGGDLWSPAAPPTVSGLDIAPPETAPPQPKYEHALTEALAILRSPAELARHERHLAATLDVLDRFAIGGEASW